MRANRIMLFVTLLIIGLSLFIYLMYEPVHVRSTGNYVEIIVDKTLLNNNSSYKIYLLAVMPTPYNIYYYSFKMDPDSNAVKLDLDKPFSDFRRYYELHGYLGDYIVPTLTINLLIYDDNGGLTVRRLVYDPLKYYTSRYSYVEAFNNAIKDPYSAFKGYSIYLGGENTYVVYSYKPLTKHIRITQDMIVSKSADYFLVLKPGLEPLYDSRDDPPDEWFRHINVRGGGREDVVKNLWKYFVLQYSLIQYYNAEHYDLDYILRDVMPSFGHDIYPNTPVIKTAENYLQDLASILYGDTVVIDWSEEEEGKEYTLDLPVIGVNVSYRYTQPIIVTITAAGTETSYYYSGWVFNGIPILMDQHLQALHGSRTVFITPNSPSTAYIVVPTKYKYVGTGFFIDINLYKAVVNGTEYWVVDPVFAPMPYYVKLVSNFNEIYATSTYDPELLENLTWSRDIVKVFSSTVTGDYPQPYSDLPQVIYDRHTKDDSLIYEMPGVVTSIAKDMLFVALKRVLGELIGSVTFLGYLLDVATNIDYMEFNARSTTMDTELLVGRYSDNLFANVEIYEATLNSINASDYIPLMIMYNITIDKPYILSGMGVHRESLEDMVYYNIGLYAYAEAVQTNYSESIFKYKLMLFNNTNIVIYLEGINETITYSIYPSGYVQLVMNIDLYSEDGERLYHYEETIFEKYVYNNPPPYPIPTSIKKPYTKPITLSSIPVGVFYLVISFKAIAESYGGYTYLDAYYDDNGLVAVISIELSENT